MLRAFPDVCVYSFVLVCARVLNTESAVFQGDHLGTKRHGHFPELLHCVSACNLSAGSR